MSQSLLFDELIELMGGAGDLFSFEALGDGGSFGEPEPVEVVLNSLLRDGALTETQSNGNREASFLVRVSAVHQQALADGVAVLHRSVGKRTTLVWTPPDGFGVPTVFEVETSSLHSPDGFDDLALLRNQVTVSLRLVCLPYARSVDRVTETAEGIPSVGTVVNAAENLTGWSTPAAVVPSATTYGEYVAIDPQPANMLAVDAVEFVAGSGSVAAKAWKVYGSRAVNGLGSGQDARAVESQVALAQSISVASGAYLSFDFKVDRPFGPTRTDSAGRTYQTAGVLESLAISAGAASRTYRNVDGPWLLAQNAIIQALPGGWVRYTLRLDEPMSITALSWTANQLVPYTDDPADAERPRILIDQVAVAETAVLGKQVLKTIDVQGSARTTGSVHVAAPSDAVALGQVVAYTVPGADVTSGFRPDIRQWLAGGGASTTSDSSATNGTYFSSMSGTTYGYTGSPKFEVPASMFTQGAHTVVARLKSQPDTDRSFGVQATLILDGAAYGTPLTAEASWHSSGTSGGAAAWEMVPVGSLYLPPVAIQSPSLDAVVRFEIKGSVTGLDDIFLFPVGGDLTIIDCGSGTVGSAASSHLWIDSPSQEQPRGGCWRSATSAREDALSAWDVTTVPGIHAFEAGTMLAFVASTDAQGPTVDFEYYPRWYTNAAR